MSETPRRRVVPVFTPPVIAQAAPVGAPAPMIETPEAALLPPREDQPAKKRWTMAQIVAPILLLLVVAGVNTLSMPNMFWVGDPFAWREETRSILADHHLWVDADLASKFGENGQYFVLNEKDGHWYSKYGIVNSLMSIPPMYIDRLISGTYNAGRKANLLVYNWYQVFLAVVTCAVLYRLTGRYSQRLFVRVLFCLTAFYTTYFWYFQRTIGSEIYQVLFFTCFFLLLTNFLHAFVRTDGRPGWRALVALGGMWFFVGLLLFTRVVFGLLIPAVGLVWLYGIWRLPREKWTAAFVRSIGMIVIPPMVLVGLLAWLNVVKFGAATNSGYHVWRPEIHKPNGPIADGLYGLLFSIQYGIPFHFPMIVFALLGWRTFFRRHRLDAVAAAMVAAMIICVLSKIPSWRGEWTYGPRYVLHMLPVMSLPFLFFVDSLIDAPRTIIAIARSCALGAVTLWVLGYSYWAQLQVNRLDFFFYYMIRSPIEKVIATDDDQVIKYFYDHHLSTIASDLYQNRDDPTKLPFMKFVVKWTSDEYFAKYTEFLKKYATQENYYWQKANADARAEQAAAAAKASQAPSQSP